MRKEGFDFCFDAKACESCNGNCCTGESGYIWVNRAEIQNLAAFCGLEEEIFVKRYLVKVGYKFSLVEKLDLNFGNCCVFFDTQNKCCSVYDARPTQCRTFPFWDYFKDKLEELKIECPGVKSV